MTKLSIDVSKQLLQECGDLGVFVAKAVKHGFQIQDIFQLVQMISSLVAFIKSGPQLLPELKDLDQSEAGQLAELAYQMAMNIYQAAKS